MGDNRSRAAAHEQRRAHSYLLLASARAQAHKETKYDYQTIRQNMSEECKRRTGLTPYEEQLDIAECMLLGLDSTAIAGTGWGKTLPFALPLFVQKKRMIIIILPLNALEADQVSEYHTH